MERLTFRDITNLLNHSRTASISEIPLIQQEDEWALYQGHYNVHAHRFPFEVLYFNARATSVGLREALKQAFEPGKTQVVYAPSIRLRDELLSKYKQNAETCLGADEYLASFIKDELRLYTNWLTRFEPKWYIDPAIETPVGHSTSRPNPIRNFLTDPDTSTSETQGMLGVVLADPGQGKTYMCQHLVAQLATSSRKVVPIFISAEQWETMRLDELGSLWKTLTHSFAYAETPIPWIAGCED